MVSRADIQVATFESLFEKNHQVLSQSTVSTWIADWDYQSTIDYVSQRPEITTVMPFMYEVTQQGDIQPLKSTLFSAVDELPKSTQVYPTIVNQLNAQRAKSFLQSRIKVKTESDFLVQEALRYGYQGYDVDIENIEPNLQDEYEYFLQYFADALHEHDLKISISIPLKTIKTQAKVAEAHNWESLATTVDFVRIMAYDVHSEIDEPGSIIPQADLEHSAQLAVEEIPKEKIIFALPTYAYDWSEGEVSSMVYSQLVTLKENYPDHEESLDEESQSIVLKYTDENGNEHQVWYESAQTLESKMTYLSNLGITQFSFWRLGDHDPDLFKTL